MRKKTLFPSPGRSGLLLPRATEWRTRVWSLYGTDVRGIRQSGEDLLYHRNGGFPEPEEIFRPAQRKKAGGKNKG
jgi:hypothetical protein